MENVFLCFVITENRKQLVNETKKGQKIIFTVPENHRKKNTWKTSYYDVFLHYGES